MEQAQWRAAGQLGVPVLNVQVLRQLIGRFNIGYLRESIVALLKRAAN